MSTPAENLRPLDESNLSRELDLASELFHRINRVIPADQQVLSVAPDMLVRDAVATMVIHGYSQVPVLQGEQILGVFSYRSFAKEAASWTLKQLQSDGCAPGDLQVDEFLEKFEFADLKAEMTSVFQAMERDNGVLVGSRDRLVGVLTPMDFLTYLHQVASPFVLLSEIELALRNLLQMAMTEKEIRDAATRVLAQLHQEPNRIPLRLEDMSFDNYRAMIVHGDTWCLVGPLFGGVRRRTSAKLIEVGQLRNDVFHFRRELTQDERESLAGHRDWLLSKVSQATRRTAAGGEA